MFIFADTMITIIIIIIWKVHNFPSHFGKAATKKLFPVVVESLLKEQFVKISKFGKIYMGE